MLKPHIPVIQIYTKYYIHDQRDDILLQKKNDDKSARLNDF